ncbi:MAG: hypothetical protein ACFFCS_14235, partial [Candidatus Hodarchaeota archaeon]
MDKEKIYQVIGVAMFCWLFGVIRFVDPRFALYFSCFAFGLMCLAFVMKLKNEFLNFTILSYLIVSFYLIGRQMLWIGGNGIDTCFTYLDATRSCFPFWVHLIMHGLPIPLCFYIMFEKKMHVNWKHFLILVIILVVWSYTMDGERFIGLPDFLIAYPLGIPLTVVYLYIYERFILPWIVKRETKKRKEKE